MRSALFVLLFLPCSLYAQRVMDIGSETEWYMDTLRIEQGHVWWIMSMDEGCACFILGKDDKTPKALVTGTSSKSEHNPSYFVYVDPDGDKIGFSGRYPLTIGTGMTVSVKCEPGSFMRVDDRH